MNSIFKTSNWVNHELIRYIILGYWSLFWLFNSIDKFIGGSQFLWVGRDRFAQFYKFFASASLDSPLITNLSLIIAAALEIFAFVFFTGALIHHIKKNVEMSRSWFFAGISLTLITFTIFAIGDHIFGDRFELLEHTLFWFITLFSWVIFIKMKPIEKTNENRIPKKQLLGAGLLTAILVVISSVSIFNHNNNAFIQRSEAIAAKQVGDNMYKVSFPFLGGSTVFENSIKLFKNQHPDERIDHIYTVPGPLRLKKADGLIFYILTEKEE